MRYKHIVLTLLLLLFTAACSGAEPSPTPQPTPTHPTGTGAQTDGTNEADDPTPEPAAPDPDPTTPSTTDQTEDDIDWPPQVVFSSPTRGQEVMLDGAITIRFDQPMNQESVQAAFAIEPQVSGEFMWASADTLVFTPQSDYERAQTYAVTISEEAQAENGRALRAPLNLQVETVGFLEVSQIVPQNGAQNIENDGAVTVIFNRPVVPLVATQDQADLVNPLTITPELQGEGEWVSTSIYRFTPTEGFAGGTNYNVTVNAGLTDVTGGVLASAVTSNFSTQPPLLLNSQPFQGASSVDPTQPISLTFSVPMDQASTQAAVVLSPSAAVEYRWNDDSTILGLHPQERLELQTTYEVSIASSAQATTGANIDQFYNIPFTTVPLPGVLRTFPMDGETNFPPENGCIEIEFASPMNWETVEDQLTIDPEPEEVEYNSFEGSTWITACFEMAYETEYTVTIPATAADPYGNTIGEDVTFSYTTGNARPLAYLNLPFGVNHFSASFPTTVGLVHRNMPRVNMQVYNAGIPYQDLLNQYVRDVPAGAELLADRHIDLSSSTVNRTNIFNWPLLNTDDRFVEQGVYYVEFRQQQDNGELSEFPQQYLIVVADTNLVVKEMVDAVYVWATDIESGRSVSGRAVTLFNEQGTELGTATTDNSGVARFDYQPQFDYLNGVLAVTGQPASEGFGVASSRWGQSINPWEFQIPADFAPEQPTTAYLFTDRPLYRPGDTVFFRGTIRDTDYGRYQLPSETEEVTLFVQAQQYFGGETEPFSYDATFTLDERGNFNGEFDLPDEVDLGTYGLSVNDEQGNWLGFVNIQVAEFRTPEFGVTMTPSEPELQRGQSAEVTLEADYFFGGSAADLEVFYTVYETDYYLPTSLPYTFTDNDFYYFWLEDFGNQGFYGNYLFDAQGRTDAFGRLNIPLPADLLNNAPDGSRRVTIEATVFDVNNQPVTSRTELVYHAADGYVGLAPEEYIGRANTDNQINLITVDWTATPLPNRPVEVILYRQEWVENDNGFWEPEETEIGREQTTTDENGQGAVTFSPEEGGTYRARATYTDAAGHEHRSSVFLWVTGSDAFWRPQPNSKAMQLIPDKDQYTAGETARVLVQSPFTEPTQAWLTIERGRLIEQRLIILQTNSDTIEIPLPAAYAPNVFVSVVAVKGEETGDGQYADIRVGIVELQVAPDPLLLNLTITPNETQYQPQDTAVFDITITDNNGAPVQTDLALSLVDKALLTLAPDNAQNISDAFYFNQPYRSQTGASLVVSVEGLDLEIEQQTEALAQVSASLDGESLEESAELSVFDVPADDAGGRAAAPTLNAASPTSTPGGEALEVRSDFRETAYWEAIITTDANGQATIEIPLPDNLTTWQLNVKAITADTLVGQDSSEITVAKPLLLRPVTPRFFTVGDVALIGTVINNNSPAEQEVTVSLAEILGAELLSDNEQTVTVPASDSIVVRWQIAITNVDTRFVDLIFAAESAEYSDATRPTFGEGENNSIPVYKFNAEDIVATSGTLNDENRRVEAILLPNGVDTEEGTLELRLNASLAAAVLDSLEALDFVDYDYTCAHSVASQLLPNTVTALTLRELELDEPELQAKLDVLVPEGINRLVELQKFDGGWGWCSSIESSPWFSAYVLLALDKAQEAGYSVPADTLNLALDYLKLQLEETNRLTESRYQVNRQAFFHYVLAEHGRANTAQLDALVEESSILLDPYGKALVMLAYGLDGGSPNQQTLLGDIFGDAILSATGAHWENDDYGNLSTDIRSTAIVLYALSEFGPDDTIGPQTVNWLMQAREAQLWRTPHESAWVLLALNSWMVSQDELNADYEYLLAVNGTAAADGSFSRDNIAETAELTLPIGQLDPAEVNFLDFQKQGNGNLYYNAYLDTFISADLVSAINRGITVQRTYYDATCDPTEEGVICEPITEIAAGQQIRVELTIIAENDLVYAVIEDYFPSGAEAIDPGLQTNPQGAGGIIQPTNYRYGYWGWWYFNDIQYRNERIVFTSQFLPRGTYQYTYTLQAVIPGEYQVRPTFAKQEFLPEVNGRANGSVFVITE